MKGISIVVSLLAIAATQVGAQTDYNYYNPAPPPAPYGQVFAENQLDQMLAPIALYPDPLIAQILPAAAQPSQIAVAANYIAAGGDPNGVDQQAWDTSVKAIAHYPQVLQLLNGNLQWTAQLGQAFMNQPTDVMNSIQRLRAQAAAQGNLQNGPQENVINDNGIIEIVPANPQIVYVPEYDPSLIYYQPGIRIGGWGIGFGIGPWLDHDFDWYDHRVVVWGRDHPRPEGWWRERPRDQREVIARAPAWRPEDHREVSHQYFAPASRGDRGYAPRENNPPRQEYTAHQTPAPRPEAPRGGHSAPVSIPRAPEAPRLPAPSHGLPTPSLPNPFHGGLPQPPLPGVFSGMRSAPETHAASSRGIESRQSVSHAAPAPSPQPAPSRGGGGGGGNPQNDRRH